MDMTLQEQTSAQASSATDLGELDTRTLFVWDSDYPWDIRVEKVCNTLRDNGAEIHLVCRNTRGSPSYERYNGLHLHRVYAWPAPKKLSKMLSFPAFFSPFWLYKIWDTARKQRCNMIVVRDLPMAPAAVVVGRLLGLPVIFDMAECYPEMLRCNWQFGGVTLKNFFVRNPNVAAAIEKWVTRRVDAIFVMIEESRARLLRMGVRDDKVVIVSNTPVLERFPSHDAIRLNDVPISPASTRNELNLVYIGLLNAPRGVDVVLRAVAILRQRGIDVNVELAGTGNYQDYLHSLARALDVDDRIHFLGWVDNQTIPDLIERADVGLVPHKKCSHWDTTIPNKLFDYLAGARPVIVSDAIPAKRIVEAEKCGLAYENDDPEELASCMVRMRSPELRARMASNGLRALVERYNWTEDTARLLATVRETRDASVR